jgi:hypothetical protein
MARKPALAANAQAGVTDTPRSPVRTGSTISVSSGG